MPPGQIYLTGFLGGCLYLVYLVILMCIGQSSTFICIISMWKTYLMSSGPTYLIGP